MSALALSFNNQPIPTISHNGQIWLTSAELAKALEYAHENAVTKIFNRNKEEFTDKMTAILPTQTGSLGESSGLQREQRIFSLRGCHLLAMFSRTEIAKQFRVWVLDILDNNVGQSTTAPQLTYCTKAQRKPLITAVRNLVATSTAKGKPLSYDEAHCMVNMAMGVECVDELTVNDIPKALQVVGKLYQKIVMGGELVEDSEVYPVRGEKVTYPIDGNMILEIRDGKLKNCEVIAKGAMVYDPRNAQGIAHLVTHYIPHNQLGFLIEAATRRLVDASAARMMA